MKLYFSLSLSLSIYIYIYTHICIHTHTHMSTNIWPEVAELDVAVLVHQHVQRLEVSVHHLARSGEINNITNLNNSWLVDIYIYIYIHTRIYNITTPCLNNNLCVYFQRLEVSVHHLARSLSSRFACPSRFILSVSVCVYVLWLSYIIVCLFLCCVACHQDAAGDLTFVPPPGRRALLRSAQGRAYDARA